MNYAIVENGVVVNIIWLHPNTEFKNAVPCDDKPVQIGDLYLDGKFFHDGEELLSLSEDMINALEILGVKV